MSGHIPLKRACIVVRAVPCTAMHLRGARLMLVITSSWAILCASKVALHHEPFKVCEHNRSASSFQNLTIHANTKLDGPTLGNNQHAGHGLAAYTFAGRNMLAISLGSARV
jgi:hypothetical protein